MDNCNPKVRICTIVGIMLLIGLGATAGAAPVAAEDGAKSLWSMLIGSWQTTIGSIFAANESDDVQGPILDPDGQQLTIPPDEAGPAPETTHRPPKGSEGR